jgi:hypothetical protein
MFSEVQRSSVALLGVYRRFVDRVGVSVTEFVKINNIVVKIQRLPVVTSTTSQNRGNAQDVLSNFGTLWINKNLSVAV